MPKMQLGLKVLCGRDNTMNNPARLHLSPQAPGEEPVDIDIPIEGGKDGDTPDEIVAKVIAAVKKAGGKASAKTATVDTGNKPTAGSGKASPTTSVLCLITIEGLESMDVASDRDKLQVFIVTGDTGPLPPPPPPGPTTPSGGKPTGQKTGGKKGGTTTTGGTGGGLTPHKGTGVGKDQGWEEPGEIDCTKAREEYEREKAEREKEAKRKKKPPKEPPEPAKPEDWFCDPRTDWHQLAQLGGIPPIGTLVVGVADIGDFDWAVMRSSLVTSGWLLVPFRVIKASLALQLYEIRMRLSAAGIVTTARKDGVIEPTRFIAGPFTGESVRSFGFATPYDPLGYTTFPWRFVVGDPANVAAHVRGGGRGAPAPTSGGLPIIPSAPRVAHPVDVGLRQPDLAQIGVRPHVASQTELWTQWADKRTRASPDPLGLKNEESP